MDVGATLPGTPAVPAPGYICPAGAPIPAAILAASGYMLGWVDGVES